MSPPLPAAAFLAIAAGVSPAFAATPEPADRYVELVTAYAAGHRAEAVAGVGALDHEDIRMGLDRLRDESPRLLRAALMLHTDRSLLERQEPDAAETAPACTSAHTRSAWEAAQLLLLDPSATDFARRWLIAMALHDRWAGCLEDAFRWSDAGARWFGADAEFLLSRGTIYESVAAMPSALPRTFAIAGTQGRQDALAAIALRESRLKEAQRSLERAVAADPDLHLARLRLGRVLWRLGNADAARGALEAVIARSGEDAVLHLAHLFLARLHQDAGRREAAIAEFRAAHALQPTSQPAAMGLSDAIQLAGETDAARVVVEAALAQAGRRQVPQSFWEYTFGNPRQATNLLDRLREDARK